MLKRTNIAIVLLLLSLGALGQNVTRKAYGHYQEGDLKRAQALIDSAITLDGEKERAQTWQIRGFVYKELVKKKGGERYAYVDTSIASFEKALEKGAAGKVKKNSEKALKYLINKHYYNQALKMLDTTNYERPKKLFERYVELKKETLDQDGKELKKTQIGFYNNLGVVFMNLWEGKKAHDGEMFNKAIEAFRKVLKFDSSNYLARYNTGIMHYNRGVQITQQLDPARVDVDISTVQKKQDQSTRHFRKALPHMKEAYDQRPKRLETVEGLSGIYYSLNEKERCNHFKQLKQKIIKERNN